MSLATDIAEAEARDRPRVKAEAIAQASSTGEFLKPGIRVTLA